MISVNLRLFAFFLLLIHPFFSFIYPFATVRLYSKRSIINGVFIYSIGDTIASLFLNQFSISRLLGICLIGGLIYSFEIPNYFKWIDEQTKSSDNNQKSLKNSLIRTALALLYFNPLWIARHLLFINLFSLQTQNINLSLLSIASKSFLINIPISFLANYLIQNVLPYKYRFTGSAVFSSLMSIYYAVSAVWFK